MRAAALNSFLVIVLAVLIGLIWFLPSDMTRPNYQFLPEMVQSIPYNAFAANPNFADGKTLRPPVAGTLTTELEPLHYQPTAEDARRAGDELQSPLPPDSAAERQQGEMVYRNFCLVCHGAGGFGDGSVVQRGFPAPPSLLAEKALKIKDGQLFHILTYGQGNMPSYASQLSRPSRWQAILYVRDLQKAAAASNVQVAEGAAK